MGPKVQLDPQKFLSSNSNSNKKVLLCNRKRRTTCHVANQRLVLSGEGRKDGKGSCQGVPLVLFREGDTPGRIKGSPSLQAGPGTGHRTVPGTGSWGTPPSEQTNWNKKVLLRECKRHTTCHVVSTPSVVLPGYPPAGYPPCPGPGGTLPGSLQQGTPLAGYPPGRVPPNRVPPILAQGVPHLGTPLTGYPQVGYPPSWPRGVPYLGTLWQGTPQQGTPWQGTPLAGYPPRCLSHGILGNVAKHYEIWVPPIGVCPMVFWVMLQSIMGYGYRPPCGQTDRHVSKHNLPVVLRTRAVNITFPHASECGW